MTSIKDMTREDFIELFGFDMSNPDDEETMCGIYDEAKDRTGKTWFEMAQSTLRQMDAMIREL